jgi:eukaryotic-like serine/threonine-protein kinase
MGEVFEAKHAATGRRVAIKIMQLRTQGADEDTSSLLKRFEREAKAMGAINSPHIVQVLDAGVDAESNEPYMVMEYMDGHDLAKTLKKTGPLPVDTVLRLAVQAAEGLAKAHDIGIVHRDIKPGNIFLAQADDGSRTVKILDFGIARYRDNEDGSSELTKDLTKTGSMLGSPQYMAPEQARGRKDIDAAADVWSMGIVLYKLLTGDTPHGKHDGGLGELLITICCVAAPSIQNRAPWVPPGLASVVHRAIDLNPRARFQHARELCDALRALLPSGAPLLTEEMFRAVSDQERSAVQEKIDFEHSTTSRGPQLPLIPPANESGSISSALIAESTHSEGPKKSGGRVLIGLGFALALGAVATAGGLFLLKKQRDAVKLAETAAVPTASAKTADIANIGPDSSSKAAESKEAVEVTVRVGGAGLTTSKLTVTVDGTPASVNGQGELKLKGTLGSSHAIKVVAGPRSVLKDVVISAKGPVPSEVMIPAIVRGGTVRDNGGGGNAAGKAPGVPTAKTIATVFE